MTQCTYVHTRDTRVLQISIILALLCEICSILLIFKECSKCSVLKIDFAALWITIQSFWPGGFPTFILVRPSCPGNSGGVGGEEVDASIYGRLARKHEARRREFMIHLDAHGRDLGLN